MLDKPRDGKPLKHDWECVAPDHGFYRWKCQNLGCYQSVQYPCPPEDNWKFKTPCGGRLEEVGDAKP